MNDKSIEVLKLLKEIIHILKKNMIKACGKSGLTSSQAMVVGILNGSGKMKINELSRSLGFTNSTLSGIIDRLEKHKIVERSRSKEDRRVVYASLSSKFDEFHQDYRSKANKNIEKIIKKGTPEEIDAIMNGLNVLKRLLTSKESGGKSL